MAETAAAIPTARRAITGADQKMAAWTVGIMLVTLIVWTAAAGSGGPQGVEEAQPWVGAPPSGAAKYILYSLPFTLGFAYHASFGEWSGRVDGRSVAALGIYVLCALTSMALNAWFDFHAIRDLAIISGYLAMFVVWFRAPGAIADKGLIVLAICMAVESASRIGPGIDLLGSDGIWGFLGLSNSFGNGLFGSHGILESTLGFPIGVILLYYLNARKWRRALVAAVLLFMAFKRITFLGVGLAVLMDILFGRTAGSRGGRIAGLVVVVLLSITAIFSTQIFEIVADTLDLQDSSADSVSVGRYNIALMLWDELQRGSLLNWMFGFGPGASDALVTENFDLINPHNDWLKILFDYGMAGLVSMHAVLFLNLARHRLGVMLYLYGAVLMTTDNVFIYMFYHPFVAMMMCTARR